MNLEAGANNRENRFFRDQSIRIDFVQTITLK